MKTKFKDREDPRNPMSARKKYPDDDEILYSKIKISLVNPDALPYRHLFTESAAKKEAIDEKIMYRLATGQKADIDPKNMKRLTLKNYEKLPEIQKKKQDAQKLEDMKAKKEKANKYQKELNERIRNQLKKKKERDSSQNPTVNYTSKER